MAKWYPEYTYLFPERIAELARGGTFLRSMAELPTVTLRRIREKLDFNVALSLVSSLIAVASLATSFVTLYVTQIREVSDVKLYVLSGLVHDVELEENDIQRIEYRTSISLTNFGTEPIAITSVAVRVKQIRSIGDASKFCQLDGPGEVLFADDFTPLVLKQKEILTQNYKFLNLTMGLPLTLSNDLRPAPETFRLGFCLIVRYISGNKGRREVEIPVHGSEHKDGVSAHTATPTQWLGISRRLE